MWLTVLSELIVTCCGIYCGASWWKSHQPGLWFRTQFTVFVLFWTSMLAMTVIDPLVGKHQELRPLLLVSGELFLVSMVVGIVLVALYIRSIRKRKSSQSSG